VFIELRLAEHIHVETPSCERGDMKRSLSFPVLPCALVVALGLLAGGLPAQDPAPDVEKPVVAEVLAKPAPASVAELRVIQDRVKEVLKKVQPATVGVRVGGASGSGVIIDAEGHVLTAGHVSGEPNQRCTIILSDGREVRGKTLGGNGGFGGVDSGMIQITEKGKWPHVEMGDSTKLKAGQWCLAVGHPGGVKKGRTAPVRLGRVLLAAKSLIQTDCTLVGGDSGGPLFDLDGKVIGIHSRIGPAITANIHVPVSAYRESWDRLVKGERWGGRRPRRDVRVKIGIGFEFGSGDLVITDVGKDSPAEKAGLKAGDVLLSIDNKKIEKRDDLTDFLRTKRPGDEIIVEVRREEKTLKLPVVLARRTEE
jgi:serine protease Do